MKSTATITITIEDNGCLTIQSEDGDLPQNRDAGNLADQLVEVLHRRLCDHAGDGFLVSLEKT